MQLQRPSFSEKNRLGIAPGPTSVFRTGFAVDTQSRRSLSLGRLSCEITAILIGLIATTAVWAADPVSNQASTTTAMGATESVPKSQDLVPLEPHIAPESTVIEIAPGAPAHLEMSAGENESQPTNIRAESPDQ